MGDHSAETQDPGRRQNTGDKAELPHRVQPDHRSQEGGETRRKHSRHTEHGGGTSRQHGTEKEGVLSTGKKKVVEETNHTRHWSPRRKKPNTCFNVFQGNFLEMI